jgi:hypothetical protein
MNRFILEGTINTIKYLEDSVIVYVDEIEKGYKKKDGIFVDDSMYTWKVIFKSNPFRQYITKFFNRGCLVEIDAKMRPFSIENGNSIDGYSCIGISINRGSYARAIKIEKKIMKESLESSMEKPNLEEFEKDDF